MHWLEKFRNGYRRPDGTRGVSREEMAAMVRSCGTNCCEELIYLIENGYITHPNIANTIAEIAGATKKQRDSMVHKDRRGGWEPPKKRRRAENALRSKANDAQGACSGRPVVMLDMYGKEFARFESIEEAAQIIGSRLDGIKNRCDRSISYKVSEFIHSGFTYRFADEWDAMSALAREADMENARKQIKRRKEKGCTSE